MEENWRYIEGSRGYYVSDLGQVKSSDYYAWNELCQTYSLHLGRILKPTNSFGYSYVTVYYTDGTFKRHRVHRLVAEYFIPNPNGYKYVNHIDGDKGNNRTSNLEWCTNSQNVQHAYDNNLIDIKNFTSVNSSQSKPHALLIPGHEWMFFGSKREMREFLGASKTVFRSPKYQKYLEENNIVYKEIGKEQYFALKSSTTIPMEV